MSFGVYTPPKSDAVYGPVQTVVVPPVYFSDYSGMTAYDTPAIADKAVADYVVYKKKLVDEVKTRPDYSYTAPTYNSARSNKVIDTTYDVKTIDLSKFSAKEAPLIAESQIPSNTYQPGVYGPSEISPKFEGSITPRYGEVEVVGENVVVERTQPQVESGEARWSEYMLLQPGVPELLKERAAVVEGYNIPANKLTEELNILAEKEGQLNTDILTYNMQASNKNLTPSEINVLQTAEDNLNQRLKKLNLEKNEYNLKLDLEKNEYNLKLEELNKKYSGIGNKFNILIQAEIAAKLNNKRIEAQAADLAKINTLRTKMETEYPLALTNILETAKTVFTTNPIRIAKNLLNRKEMWEAEVEYPLLVEAYNRKYKPTLPKLNIEQDIEMNKNIVKDLQNVGVSIRPAIEYAERKVIKANTQYPKVDTTTYNYLKNIESDARVGYMLKHDYKFSPTIQPYTLADIEYGKLKTRVGKYEEIKYAEGIAGGAAAVLLASTIVGAPLAFSGFAGAGLANFGLYSAAAYESSKFIFSTTKEGVELIPGTSKYYSNPEFYANQLAREEVERESLHPWFPLPIIGSTKPIQKFIARSFPGLPDWTGLGNVGAFDTALSGTAEDLRVAEIERARKGIASTVSTALTLSTFSESFGQKLVTSNVIKSEVALTNMAAVKTIRFWKSPAFTTSFAKFAPGMGAAGVGEGLGMTELYAQQQYRAATLTELIMGGALGGISAYVIGGTISALQVSSVGSKSVAQGVGSKGGLGVVYLTDAFEWLGDTAEKVFRTGSLYGRKIFTPSKPYYEIFSKPGSMPGTVSVVAELVSSTTKKTGMSAVRMPVSVFTPILTEQETFGETFTQSIAKESFTANLVELPTLTETTMPSLTTTPITTNIPVSVTTNIPTNTQTFTTTNVFTETFTPTPTNIFTNVNFPVNVPIEAETTMPVNTNIETDIQTNIPIDTETETSIAIPVVVAGNLPAFGGFLLLTDSGGRGQGGALGKKKKSYQPSFDALLKGIYSTTFNTKSIFTGQETRPIIGKPRKGMKIKFGHEFKDVSFKFKPKLAV